MTEHTLSRRTQQLVYQLKDHPHKDEILVLMREQLQDDAEIVTASTS